MITFTDEDMVEFGVYARNYLSYRKVKGYKPRVDIKKSLIRWILTRKD